MKLSKETRDQLQDIFETVTNLNFQISRLSRLVEEDTDNKISVCPSYISDIQLYQNPLQPAEDVKEIVSEISDRGMIESWKKEDTTCYKFSIDDKPLCILISE